MLNVKKNIKHKFDNPPKVLLVSEECSRYSDEKGRRRQKQLFRAAHTAGQQRDGREHVLEGIQHGHQRHH